MLFVGVVGNTLLAANLIVILLNEIRGKMKLIHGDCLEALKTLPDKSVDLILQDPPYNTTACKWEWDIMTKIDEFWAEWKRVIKDNSTIVMTASQPFTSKLVMSNLKMFKYEWVWEKEQGVNFLMAKKQPMKVHENIIVFGGSNYFPQMTKGKPSQKPVALMEYLVKTYTNKGDTVFDGFMGSGTTGVACNNLNRDFIGIEIDKEYFEIAKKRIEGTQYNQSFQRINR